MGNETFCWDGLGRKLRIYINSEKKDNLVRCTQIFGKFFLETPVPFDIHPGISEMFGRMVRFSEIQQFPDFLELFPGNSVPVVPVSKISEFLVKW